MKVCNSLNVLCTRRYPIDSTDFSKGYACTLPDNDIFGCVHEAKKIIDTNTNEIDNFKDISDKILDFKTDGDFFLVLVLKRRKDINGRVVDGVNEDNRLIKHYFVYSKEYLSQKKQAIINLCRANNARAYILPQRRSTDVILWEIHEKTGKLIREGNSGVHFDHLIRTCVAGCHKSDRPLWVIDIDKDNELFLDYTEEQFNAYVDELKKRIAEIRVVYGQTGDGFILETIKTPHGIHIITEPFNKQELVSPKKTELISPIFADWIKSDAMTLLYCNV